MKKKLLTRLATGFNKNTLSYFTILTLSLGSLLITSERASAVLFTGSQTSLTEWTYDLTYESLDNYSIYQDSTTITLTGLFGVTSATGPTSTDFSAYLDNINLEWTAAVLDGGTTVAWTHQGPGTGNFSIDKHAYGFKVFADGAVDGLASFSTDGFSRDTSNPLPGGTYDLDIIGTTSGPVAPGPVAPVPEPATMLLLGVGLMGIIGSRIGKKKK